jgi:hypothetical protein
MSDKTVPRDYANSLLYDLQKAFWDERGKGARFRTITVGREYFQDRCRARLQSADLDHILATIAEVLKSEGIAETVEHSTEGRLLRIQVGGCVHLPVEGKLAAHGVEPITCVAANLVVQAIEERLDKPVELAEVKVRDGTCSLLLVLFDKRPSLEQG